MPISRNLAAVTFLVTISTILPSCVQFVSLYDEQTDAGATAIQKKTETFIDGLLIKNFPDCSYSNNKKFYEDIAVDLSSLNLRVSAIPENSRTMEQVTELKASIADLEAIHKLHDKSCIDAAVLRADQSGINSTIGAILKLEIEKKRGKSS